MKKNFQLFIMPAITIIVSIVLGVISGDYFWGIITLIFGFLNAYYMAIGKWYNYIFGLLFSLSYAFVCGKNDAYRGIKGFFKSIIDSLILGASVADGSSRAEFGYDVYECDFSKIYRWKLSEYMERTPVEKVKEKWDELEKSIIMNFSDDISISIRDDLIEMVIIKNI